MTQESQVDRKDLKIAALRERLSQIVVEYEDRDADRRIDITELSQRLTEATQQNQTLQEQVQGLEGQVNASSAKQEAHNITSLE